MASPLKSPAEVMVEWQKQRTWRSIAVGIMCAVQLILLVAFLLARRAGEAPFVPIFTMFLPFLVMSGVVKRTKRCPSCGKDAKDWYQPIWRVKNCKNCGAQLRE
jgi:hypothetical protein